jgi:hypothetical protein
MMVRFALGTKICTHYRHIHTTTEYDINMHTSMHAYAKSIHRCISGTHRITRLTFLLMLLHIISSAPQVHRFTRHTHLFFSIRKTLLISRLLHRDDTKTLKHLRPLYNEDTHSHTKDLKKERHTNYTQSED